MAVPRTLGRRPIQRERPALPNETPSCSRLLTDPTVARQSCSTRRISPEGRRRRAYLPSFAINCAQQPAERAICPPLPGFNSILCKTVPTGICLILSELPGVISADLLETTSSPTCSF